MAALDHCLDTDRRAWLAGATATAGAGLAATAVPFVASLAPSERARALGAPVEVRLDDLGPGTIKTVEWRGRPVFVLRRSPSMLDQLDRHDGLLADPRSLRSEQPEAARNPSRSLRTDIVVRSRLHAPRLRAHVPPGAESGRHRQRLARRLLLSLPRLQVRSGRPGVQERAGTNKPRCSAA